MSEKSKPKKDKAKLRRYWSLIYPKDYVKKLVGRRVHERS